MGLTFLDDKTLVTCGHIDGELQIWDVESGKVLACLQIILHLLQGRFGNQGDALSVALMLMPVM